MAKLKRPKKLKRQRKHGYLQRAKTHTGKKLLARRRGKGRKRLAV